MTTLSIFTKALLTTSIVLIIILAPLFYFTFNQGFYQEHIKKTDFKELGKEKAKSLINNVLSFLQDKEELSPEFSQEERSHMFDVKKVLSFSRILLILAVSIIAAGVITGYMLLRVTAFFLRPIFYASMITLILVFLVLLGILFDFSSIFLGFHEIFFPQGNFTFPAGSLLITLFPFDFFLAITTNIFVTILVISLVIFAASFFLLRKKK